MFFDVLIEFLQNSPKGEYMKIREGIMDMQFVRLIYICLLLLTPHSGFSQLQKLSNKELIQIEKELWHASQEELPIIEQRITRIIQADRRSVMGYFLLNQLYLRYFRSSPNQTHLIDQAAETAFQTRSLEPNNPLGVIAIIDL